MSDPLSPRPGDDAPDARSTSAEGMGESLAQELAPEGQKESNRATGSDSPRKRSAQRTILRVAPFVACGTIAAVLLGLSFQQQSTQTPGPMPPNSTPSASKTPAPNEGKLAKTAVPNILGQTLFQATKDIQARKLTLGTVTESDTRTGLPEGTVLSQEPGALTLLDPGSVVNLTVSGPTTYVIVPNLFFMTEDAANGAIRAAGLVPGQTRRLPGTTPVGTVFAQSHSPDLKIPLGSSLALTLSNGQALVFNVIGQTEAEATKKLLENGFKIKTIVGRPNAGRSGTVVAQNPKRGDYWRDFGVVTITIAP